jgi:hypothetical protein
MRKPLHEWQQKRERNWQYVSTTVLREAYDVTHNLRYPSFTIHLSNLSRAFSSFGRSPLISPDINILVNGGHLDLSDTLTDPTLLLSKPLLDILQARDLTSTLKASGASLILKPLRRQPFILPIIGAK